MANFFKHHEAKYLIYLFFFLTLLIISVHYLLDAGLSCID
jgi:hypothetical protein